MASGRRSSRPPSNKVEVSYFLSQEVVEELAEAIAFYNEQASTSIANAFLSEFTRAAARRGESKTWYAYFTRAKTLSAAPLFLLARLPRGS